MLWKTKHFNSFHPPAAIARIVVDSYAIRSNTIKWDWESNYFIPYTGDNAHLPATLKSASWTCSWCLHRSCCPDCTGWLRCDVDGTAPISAVDAVAVCVASRPVGEGVSCILAKVPDARSRRTCTANSCEQACIPQQCINNFTSIHAMNGLALCMRAHTTAHIHGSVRTETHIMLRYNVCASGCISFSDTATTRQQRLPGIRGANAQQVWMSLMPLVRLASRACTDCKICFRRPEWFVNRAVWSVHYYFIWTYLLNPNIHTNSQKNIITIIYYSRRAMLFTWADESSWES